MSSQGRSRRRIQGLGGATDDAKALRPNKEVTTGSSPVSAEIRAALLFEEIKGARKEERELLARGARSGASRSRRTSDWAGGGRRALTGEMPVAETVLSGWARANGKMGVESSRPVEIAKRRGGSRRTETNSLTKQE